MIRTNERHRSLLLAGLIVVAAAIGTVGAVGTVGAQDAENGTDGNASEAGFYSPSADDPLNARFRDCCANTVDSVDGGVLNLNIVLSDEQVDGITYGPETDLPPTDLDRTDIVGMNLSGVETGEYEFVVSVVGADAATTVPLEITGKSGTDEESNGSAANETTTTETTSDGTQEANGTTMANETEMGAENGTTMANETTDNGTMANETTMMNGTMMNGTMMNGTNVSVVAEPNAANA
ncbi:PGF-CTERM sorting domain-containing protein, partial [Halobacteriales archaeon QH_9_66_26]